MTTAVAGEGEGSHQAKEALRQQISQLQEQLSQERQAVEAARSERLQQLHQAVQAVGQAQDERRQAAAALAESQEQLAQAQADDSQAQLSRVMRLLHQHGFAQALPQLQNLDAAMQDWESSALQLALEERLELLRAQDQPRRGQDDIYDRRGEPAQVSVLEWGAAQRVALGEKSAQRGLLTRDDGGAWLIQGPDLPRSTTASNVGWLDVSGRLASEPPRPRGITGFIERGGPFVWPIFAIALAALATALLRLGLRLAWRQPQGAAAALLRSSDQQQALSQARAWRGPIGTILVGILQSAPQQRQEIAGAVLAEAEVHLSRGLRLLAVLAAAAPLLGLLGTVTGMIASFEALGAEAGADAERLSAGIGQALLTTELGLMVAVPTLIVHALFARDASRWRSRCEAEALRLLSALDSLHQAPDKAPDQESP